MIRQEKKVTKTKQRMTFADVSSGGLKADRGHLLWCWLTSGGDEPHAEVQLYRPKMNVEREDGELLIQTP